MHAGMLPAGGTGVWGNATWAPDDGQMHGSIPTASGSVGYVIPPDVVFCTLFVCFTLCFTVQREDRSTMDHVTESVPLQCVFVGC